MVGMRCHQAKEESSIRFSCTRPEILEYHRESLYPSFLVICMGLTCFGIMKGADKVCTIGQVPGWLPRRCVAFPGHKISESAVIVLTIQDFINFPLLVLSDLAFDGALGWVPSCGQAPLKVCLQFSFRNRPVSFLLSY